MLDSPKELADLKPIRIEDQSTFVTAANEDDRTSWLYFFPFLHGFASGSTQTLLWEKVNGALCLYYLKERESDHRLHLYLPPFPYSPEALKHGLQRSKDFNRTRSARIMWVEENQKDLIAGQGFDTEVVEQEYIYDSELVRRREGSRFERLRRKVNQVNRIEGLEIRSYVKEDEEACLDLFDRWRRFLRDDRNIRVVGQNYQRNCIVNALSFGDEILRGEVILVDGRLCAFTFGGKITSAFGSLFVAVSDHAVPGLGYVQRTHLFSNIDGVRFFNDSSDAGRSSLADVKKSFNPVAMNTLYRALA